VLSDALFKVFFFFFFFLVFEVNFIPNIVMFEEHIGEIEVKKLGIYRWEHFVVKLRQTRQSVLDTRECIIALNILVFVVNKKKFLKN
jgi:hypothetical protein